MALSAEVTTFFTKIKMKLIVTQYTNTSPDITEAQLVKINKGCIYKQKYLCLVCG